MKIKTGDLVKVMSGGSKGKQGKVTRVYPAKNRAIVEGVNLIKKHTKPSAENPQGGIVEREAALNISNLALVDPKTNEPTKVGYRLEDGKKVRFAKKSNTVLN